MKTNKPLVLFWMILLIFTPVWGQDKDPQIFGSNATSGSTTLFTASGSGADTVNGDYVSSALDRPYRFFVEVTPGLNRLVVEIFDADIGRGRTNESITGRDRVRGTSDTLVEYSLIDPSGTVRAILIGSNNAGADNAWDSLFNNTTQLTPGHWEVRVDMSSAVTFGDDINAFGIRAHDGDSTSGGRELNVYIAGIVPVGVNPPSSGTNERDYKLYPYITSGCSFAKNDFDFDSNRGDVGSMTFIGTARFGGYNQSFAGTSLSSDNSWRRDNISGWTTNSESNNYGIWDADFRIRSYQVGGQQNGNYGNVYLSSFQAAQNPPANNPPSNSFRIYLPTDQFTPPLKPYLNQSVTHLSGPNPINVGQTGIVRVRIDLVNPTAYPVTFSSSNLITASIPAGNAVFTGTANAGQGTILTRPPVGGTGSITWNPGVVAPGGTAILLYNLRVTPIAVNQQIPLTATPASGGGTRATYLDETGNTAQALATYTFGPLCEIAVIEGFPIRVNPNTSAGVNVSGRVTTSGGYPVRNGVVEATNSAGETKTARTNPFGFFRFNALTTGETYIFRVQHKRHTFTPQAVNVTGEITDLNLTAL